VVSGLALSGTMTASVSGALLVSAEVLGVLAVAVMVNPGFLLKILIVVDEYTRFLIAADVSSSIDSTRVFRTLEYAILMYGKPECLRSDNGPEFMSRATTLWTI
jgi:hypothetical protein